MSWRPRPVEKKGEGGVCIKREGGERKGEDADPAMFSKSSQGKGIKGGGGKEKVAGITSALTRSVLNRSQTEQTLVEKRGKEKGHLHRRRSARRGNRLPLKKKKKGGGGKGKIT